MVMKNDFYEKYCRVCGSTDGICVNLFCSEGIDYLTKVQRLLNIEISKDDKLPKNICHMCMSFISDFDKFRNFCGSVQERLNKLACNFNQEKETIKPNISTSNNIDTVDFNKQNRNIRKNASDQINGCHSIDMNSEECTNREPRVEENPINVSVSNQCVEPKIELKTESTSRDWTVQNLPGKDTKLYICRECPAMLLSESAIQSHQCESNTAVTRVLLSDELMPPGSEEANKKKRKRIIYEIEDD